MSEKFQSYTQGYRDTCIELGDDAPDGYQLGDSPDVSEEALVLEEYLRGQVAALISHIKQKDAARGSDDHRTGQAGEAA